MTIVLNITEGRRRGDKVPVTVQSVPSCGDAVVIDGVDYVVSADRPRHVEVSCPSLVPDRMLSLHLNVAPAEAQHEAENPKKKRVPLERLSMYEQGMPQDRFASLLRLAAEKGWVEDRDQALEDLAQLDLATEGARRHNAHRRMVLNVLASRWLPRLVRLLKPDVGRRILANELRVTPTTD